ncbi:MAG: trigger factor [FCB group bacterium]|nr:trigger factor [FCB group bacterium]
MKIDVVEKEGLKRELTIEVPAEIVDETFEKIYTAYRLKAKIDGFRPGKVPLNVIRKRFKGDATAALIDELTQKYYEEAIKETKLEPVGNPTLSDFDVDDGKPLTFTIGIEVMPQIDSVKHENITVNDEKFVVPDKDVDQALENFRKGQAEVRPVERPAGDDDVLVCDLEPTAEPGFFDQDKYENQEIDLSNEFTDKEFREGLAGCRPEDVREIKIDYADDYGNERFAGKSVSYKITVREVKERILPPLNDDLAKMSGQAETLLELKLSIRKQMETELETQTARVRKKTIIDQVVAQNVIEVPETMLESYLKGVIEDNKKQDEKADEKELREKYSPIGTASIQWYLLYHRLAIQEKIEVSPEDTENWIKKFAESYRMEIPKAKEILAKTGRVGEIKDGILEEKVLDFLASTTGGEKG